MESRIGAEIIQSQGDSDHPLIAGVVKIMKRRSHRIVSRDEIDSNRDN
jgi:hypothetical protein